MCLQVKKIHKKGQYKETSFKAQKGDTYNISTWQKCGQCSECMNEKANNWLIRNYYEAKQHKNICFITLTYKDNPRYLIKKHLQDFLKRFRRRIEPTKIRYFGCGEYGTIKGRPHFHLIIYGWKDENAKYTDINKKGNAISKSELIEKCWGKGITSYQEFNITEIPYISLYQSPNLENKKAIQTNKKILAKKSELREIYKSDLTALKKLEQKMSKTNSKYQEIKEFNIWSTAIGFDEWLKQYKSSCETWTEYVLDGEYLTPSPWVKQMANLGEEKAIKECIKRKNFEIKREQTTEERKAEKEQKEQENHIKDIINEATKNSKFYIIF